MFLLLTAAATWAATSMFTPDTDISPDDEFQIAVQSNQSVSMCYWTSVSQILSATISCTASSTLYTDAMWDDRADIETAARPACVPSGTRFLSDHHFAQRYVCAIACDTNQADIGDVECFEMDFPERAYDIVFYLGIFCAVALGLLAACVPAIAEPIQKSVLYKLVYATLACACVFAIVFGGVMYHGVATGIVTGTAAAAFLGFMMLWECITRRQTRPPTNLNSSPLDELDELDQQREERTLFIAPDL